MPGPLWFRQCVLFRDAASVVDDVGVDVEIEVENVEIEDVDVEDTAHEASLALSSTSGSRPPVSAVLSEVLTWDYVKLATPAGSRCSTCKTSAATS